MTFEVVTAASVKITYCPLGCLVVHSGKGSPTIQRYLVPPLSPLTALIMDAARSCETSVNYKSTRHNIPEDSHLKLAVSVIDYIPRLLVSFC